MSLLAARAMTGARDTPDLFFPSAFWLRGKYAPPLADASGPYT
jgi:hypothetical protein